MPKPRFDWTVNLGHLLTIAALLLSMSVAYATYRVTISDLDSRVRTLEKNDVLLDTRTNDTLNLLYTIRQDLAIVKYRLEQEEKRK